jgi:hypothetical protein
MKLSGKSLVLLVAGITLIMVFSLGMVYINSSEQQEELTEQLNIIQPVLTRTAPDDVSPEMAEMENRQQAAELELENAKEMLRQPIYAIGIARELFDIAEATDVDILSISSPGVMADVLGGLPFLALAARVEIEGDTADLVAFVAALGQQYSTGFITSLQFDIPDPEDEETDEDGNPKKPSAFVDVQIFTYEGS